MKTPVFCRFLRPVLCLASLAWCLCAHAQKNTPPAGPPHKGDSGELDLAHFPGTVIDDVVVPVPSEVFGVLDKLGDPDWKKQISTNARPNFSDRTDVALLLGAVVADGFIAVQAEDQQSVESVGREVLSLAKILGVREAVVEHCDAIQEAAKANQWDVVRKELDATQRTVRDKMESLKDGALAECVSVGGWLRGTEAITSVISQGYSQEKAELLNQPDLAEYFCDSLEAAQGKLSQPGKVKAIILGLGKIRALMKAEGSLSASQVAEMQSTTAVLVKSITTKP